MLNDHVHCFDVGVFFPAKSPSGVLDCSMVRIAHLSDTERDAYVYVCEWMILIWNDLMSLSSPAQCLLPLIFKICFTSFFFSFCFALNRATSVYIDVQAERKKLELENSQMKTNHTTTPNICYKKTRWVQFQSESQSTSRIKSLICLFCLPCVFSSTIYSEILNFCNTAQWTCACSC